MKIKLSSTIVEAKGVIGGHYVSSNKYGSVISRKRSRSGQAQVDRPINSLTLKRATQRWHGLSNNQRNTWTALYGSKLKGYRQFVSQSIYRAKLTPAEQMTVSNSVFNSICQFISFTYTSGTKTITVLYNGSHTVTNVRGFQIKDYSANGVTKNTSGWITVTIASNSDNTNVNISNGIKATGRQITDKTRFMLRVVQIIGNTAPVIITQPVWIICG